MKNINACEKVNVTSSPVRSFRSVLESVKAQVNYSSFDRYERPRVEELCKIIAEVYCLNPDCKISIGKEEHDAWIVQERYSELDERHITIIMEEFDTITHKIYSIKSYLRTALYNSDFVLRHRCDNEDNVRAAE